MRPLIAVSGRPTAAGQPWRLPGFGSQANYLDALSRAGAFGAVLQPAGDDETELGDQLARFDGLLLTGGPDLDPALYGQVRHETVTSDNPALDRFELALCRAALRAGLPLLAVCRGMQVLNVARGGTLHQHIGDRPEGRDHGQPGVAGARPEIRLRVGSRLAGIVGATTACAACFHHQAVDRLGEGLVATAWAADGVVEALEPATGALSWLLAVQWHPETVADREPAHQAIFDAFVAACAPAGSRSSEPVAR